MQENEQENRQRSMSKFSYEVVKKVSKKSEWNKITNIASKVYNDYQGIRQKGARTWARKYASKIAVKQQEYLQESCKGLSKKGANIITEGRKTCTKEKCPQESSK